ncbi:MAG: hypothetical protein MUF01_08800 [Bryobacterales bacterium]|jgi:hypothetical protein|nr:hypothetical protein [Bryobacterales bacterium]
MSKRSLILGLVAAACVVVSPAEATSLLDVHAIAMEGLQQAPVAPTGMPLSLMEEGGMQALTLGGLAGLFFYRKRRPQAE